MAIDRDRRHGRRSRHAVRLGAADLVLGPARIEWVASQRRAFPGHCGRGFSPPTQTWHPFPSAGLDRCAITAGGFAEPNELREHDVKAVTRSDEVTGGLAQLPELRGVVQYPIRSLGERLDVKEGGEQTGPFLGHEFTHGSGV